MCVYTQVPICTYISLLCQARGPRSYDTPIATLHTSTRTLVSSERNQGSLEKRLILGWGQEIHTMNLEHLVMPESKEMLTAPHPNKPTA